MSFLMPHMAPALKDHALTPRLETANYKSFLMRRPDGSRMMGCELMFTPEGIVILGDLTPCGRGVISDLGYGLSWFSKPLSEDYLCSKFLTKGWHRELVEADIASQLADAEAALAECLRELREEHEDIKEGDASDEYEYRDAVAWREIAAFWYDETSEKELHEFASERLCDFWDYGIGDGYKPADSGWLCAIQHRFSALFQARMTA